ncbi:MAG TPA: hypothetical protein VJT84_11080 [Gaiellaceae bacterium]|nr:hypothetical protein [Gaiellaceae bacterium]
MRLAAVTLASLAVLLAAGSAGAQSNVLVATVGPGFSIRIADSAGNRVTQVAPGAYTIQVHDLSEEHNFHLTGPGVDMTTEVGLTGDATWNVTLQDGTYHYQCDPHFTSMRGDLRVGSALPPTTTTTTTTTPTPKPVPKPVTLLGTVSSTAISVKSLAGKRVLSLKAGAVVIRVADLSKTQNFHLTGPGVNRLTTKAGLTKASWKLTLKRGTYVYRSDANPKLRGTFRAV